MSEQPVVMVVDDDEGMRGYLSAFLEARGFASMPLESGEAAVARFQHARPAAVILDLVMPGGMDGLTVLAALKKVDRDVPVIVVSAQGHTNTVVQAMKLGAADFVSKPFEDAELDGPLANAIRHHHVHNEVASLREELESRSKYSMLFGRSERMLEVRDLIDRVADTDVTVLLRGESGTGKEMVARTIYDQSLRRGKPFVKVNCAALPTELLESELFGYERGAFTGAVQQKPGKFEFANHGTMFLDEISEMSPVLQAKLLQVLQDGEFSRLGGKADVHVDVRILAATNRDLEQAVVNGAFREDLFFRLNVVAIVLPPLRQRRDEIPILAEYFLKKCAVQYNKPLTELSIETMRTFMDYDWPGNVRELENTVKRLVILNSETQIQKELARAMSRRAALVALPQAGHLPAPPLAAAPARVGAGGNGNGNGHGDRSAAAVATAPAVPIEADAQPGPGTYSLKDIARTAAREAERELIAKMLQQTRWNRKETAEILGISYKALLYKIKENGLDKAPPTT
ncbi:MAG: sigma-54-dependent transcriptional regulator [Bacteroidales bacterium]